MLDFTRSVRRGATRLALCALVFFSAFAAGVPPKDTLLVADVADLWWDPAESGWGMQIVAGGNALFATLFVYGANGEPIFYTATLERGATGWSGDLYRTTGPFFGAPAFDPTRVQLTKVGSLFFADPVNDVATLAYSVNSVNVVKPVQRQLLRYDDYNGHYTGTLTLTRSNCPDPAMNVSSTGPTTIAVTQNGAVMTMDMTLPAGEACTLSGPYAQAGHVGSLAASFTCASGATGAMALSGMTNRSGTIAGRLDGHATSNGCDYRGRFAGVVLE